MIAVACGGAAAVAAVYVWLNGQTDGYLPNNVELNLLYLQKNVVGAFGSGGYWSSSENSSFVALGHYFGGNNDGLVL